MGTNRIPPAVVIDAMTSDGSAKAKRLTPASVECLLADARSAADQISKGVTRFEQLSDAQLASEAEALYELHDAITERFVFAPPLGQGHEGPVIEYEKWKKARGWEVIQEFRRIVEAMPDDSFVRFLQLISKLSRVVVEQGAISAQGSNSAINRWSRLNSVKEWAFEQRLADPPPRSRAAVIRRILPAVKDKAKEAGEPLTGDEPAVIRTVTGWFKKAGIK